MGVYTIMPTEFKPYIFWEKFVVPEEEFGDFMLKHKSEYPQTCDNPYIEQISSQKVFISEANRPSKMFESWYIHLPYVITDKLAKIIQDIIGVERFVPVSKYRGVIVFGKSFYDTALAETPDVDKPVGYYVQHLKNLVEAVITANAVEKQSEIGEINTTLYVKPELKKILDKTISAIKSKDKPVYTMLILPNGKIDYACDKTKSVDILHKNEIFEQTREATGGIVLNSWDMPNIIASDDI